MLKDVFTYLNNKAHLTCVESILNYDGLWENKKLSFENQRLDWIKSIY